MKEPLMFIIQVLNGNRDNDLSDIHLPSKNREMAPMIPPIPTNSIIPTPFRFDLRTAASFEKLPSPAPHQPRPAQSHLQHLSLYKGVRLRYGCLTVNAMSQPKMWKTL